MIKVILSNNLERRIINTDGEKTVRQILEDAGMFLAGSRTMMNGTPLTAGEMNFPLMDLGVEDTCCITHVAAQNNACGVSIVGAVAVLESDLTLAQIKMFRKYRPDALIAVNKDNDPLFSIDLADTPEGSLSKDRAAFGTVTSMKGNATITIPVGAHPDPVEYIAEEYGPCLNIIRRLEENALAQISDLEEECAAIRAMITRA